MFHDFCVLSKNLCLTLGHKNFPLCSTYFIVLDLMFQSIIHMELIFHTVKGVD